MGNLAALLSSLLFVILVMKQKYCTPKALSLSTCTLHLYVPGLSIKQQCSKYRSMIHLMLNFHWNMTNNSKLSHQFSIHYTLAFHTLREISLFRLPLSAAVFLRYLKILHFFRSSILMIVACG